MTLEPWIDEEALNEWDRITDAASRPFDVFKWGSGGSTLWFGAKRIGTVVSIEHDLDWYHQVKTDKAKLGLDNVTVMHIPAVPEIGCCHSIRSPHLNFFAYSNILVDLNRLFDFIFVDGRARVLCFRNAVHYLKDKGHVVLHDAERTSYAECRDIAKAHGFRMREIREIRTTLVCQRP